MVRYMLSALAIVTFRCRLKISCQNFCWHL